ncbi:thiamine phosphate synthase [Orbus mooreae]|uniref:thiamine phosphate synthase n=1 Tax=Orbus mooreae TaxID=3074107 RepID=UPI00370D575A
MQKRLDLSLYLVLDPSLCGGIEGMVNTTRVAVENGVTAVQLRAESPFHRKDWYTAALALKQVLISTSVPLIINDNVDIALAADVDGVHIGQNDLPVSVVRKLIGNNKILGLSVSNEQELSAVPWSAINYLGVGPIFPTTSKKNAAPALGINQFAQLIKNKKCPAVGIGGINATNICDVIQTGIDGVAVVSAICGQEDIKSATQQLVAKIIHAKQKGR